MAVHGHSATHRKPPSLDKLAASLNPILAVGLPVPVNGNNALDAFRDLFELDGDPIVVHREANDILTEHVAKAAGSASAAAAETLFVREKKDDPLEARQGRAALRMRKSIGEFRETTQPYMLSLIAFNLIQEKWPKEENSGAHRARTWRRLFVSVMMIALLLAVLSGWAPVINYGVERGIRVASAIVLFLICASWAFRSIRRAMSRSRGASAPKPGLVGDYPSPEFLDECQKQAARRLEESRVAIVLMVDMILSPRDYRARTVERISLEGRCLRQRVSLDLAFNALQRIIPPKSQHGAPNLPSASERPTFLYVPFLIPPKGMLIDQLEVMRRDDSILTTLSYEQSTRVLSFGLRLLLVRAMSTSPQPLDDILADPEFTEVEIKLLQIMGRRGPIIDGSALWTAVRDNIGAQIAILEKKFAVDWQDLLNVREYVLRLARHYPVIVSLPDSEDVRRRIIYTRVVVPKATVHRGVPDRIRIWFGLRPNRVVVPLTLAFQSDSYHLNIVGSEDHYLYEQFYGCHSCGGRLTNKWRGNGETGPAGACRHLPIGVGNECYIRPRYRAGQNYAHLYMRGFSAAGLGGAGLAADVRFVETPPGVEGHAAIAALVAGVFIDLVGYLHLRTGGAVSVNFVALMLALPAFAASWFGFSSEASTVLRSSMAARVSLFATGALSIAAACCYLVRPTTALGGEFPIGLFGIHESGWLALSAVASLGAFLMITRVATRMRHFAGLASKPRYDHDYVL